MNKIAISVALGYYVAFGAPKKRAPRTVIVVGMVVVVCGNSSTSSFFAQVNLVGYGPKGPHKHGCFAGTLSAHTQDV